MKMNRKALAALISSAFSLGAVGAPLNALLPAALVQNGALVDGTALNAILQQVILAGLADSQQQFSTSAGASATLTSIQNLFQRFTNGGAVTVTIDYAYNIVNTLVNPFIGQVFGFQILTNAATTIATPTLSDTAVTLSGTTSLPAASMRWYQGQVTQVVTTTGSALTAGSTFTSIAQVGSTNAFTVTLGTNAISPVVGNGFFIGTTTGTLPPGWYPVVKVTSATSFVIATPAGTVWTATAATLNGATTIPVSGYTPGLAGLYSPLLTITGMGSTVTGTNAV
jgi:hypothetical protein